MKKTLFLPLILSIALIISPNKAKAYVPVMEIIIGIQVATAVAVAAAPYVKKLYKALKKKGKKFIAFIKKHRGKNRQDVLEDEDLNRLSAPSVLAAANQDLEETVNPLALIPQVPHNGGYSRTLKVMQEESNFFSPSVPALMPALAPAMMPALSQLEDGFKEVVLGSPVPHGSGYSRKITRYEEETRYFGGGF
ncbi:MAG TPA: hypothetical protein DD412_06505 [Holosporales bacterium]|nr:hypothetical protein [Holosporales bacterium]